MSDAQPSDVFKPGGLPSITYVNRNRLRLEDQLRRGVERDHSFTVVSGPTKTGKTVLSKHVLGEDQILPVDAGSVRTIDEFWSHVAYKLKLASSAAQSKTKGWSLGGAFEGGFSLSGLFTSKASATAARSAQGGVTATYANVPVLSAINALRDRGLTLVIEDFHYLESDVQRGVLRSLKNAVADGLRVVILAVPHRSFDPISVEGELAGRVEHVHLPNWALNDLSEIASRGFAQLGLAVPSNVQTRICEDGFGNPLLVQDICLRVAEAMIDRGSLDSFGGENLAAIYDAIVEARGTQRFARLFRAHPPGERVARLALKEKGGEGPLPAAILLALARLGPRPTTSLDEIVAALEVIAETMPSEGEIIAALVDLAQAGGDGGSPALEWREAEQQFVISDPYLLFHLKWEINDRRTMRLPARTVERLVTGEGDGVRDIAEGEQ